MAAQKQPQTPTRHPASFEALPSAPARKKTLLVARGGRGWEKWSVAERHLDHNGGLICELTKNFAAGATGAYRPLSPATAVAGD